MALTLLPVSGPITEHTGSTEQGPVAGTVASSQSFVTIDDVAIIVFGDIMSTPSHIYGYDPFGVPLYHSHTQAIAVSLQDFVFIEGVKVAQLGDNSGSDLTTIVSTTQNFVY